MRISGIGLKGSVFNPQSKIECDACAQKVLALSSAGVAKERELGFILRPTLQAAGASTAAAASG